MLDTHHIGVTSTRMNLTTGKALALIGSHCPQTATTLLRDGADLVAAFARVTDTGEHWTAFVFATRLGTECITLAAVFGGYDAEMDFFDDDLLAFTVERSDAFGHGWTKCDTHRLFPIPSGQMIFGKKAE